MTGFREDIPEVIAALDALVVPSHAEAQSLVIPQAFASAKPVIASAVGGIPELVDDGRNGLLTPPGDATGLAEAMERFVTDPQLRKRLSEAGLRHAHTPGLRKPHGRNNIRLQEGGAASGGTQTRP